MICSRTLADEAQIVYDSGKEFAYDHMMQSTMVPFKKDTDTRLNITVLLWSHMSRIQGFQKIYLPKLHPGQRYNQWLAQHAVYQRHKREGHGKRPGASFEGKNKTALKDMKKFYTEDKFGFYLCSMEGQTMPGFDTPLANTTDSIQLARAL